MCSSDSRRASNLDLSYRICEKVQKITRIQFTSFNLPKPPIVSNPCPTVKTRRFCPQPAGALRHALSSTRARVAPRAPIRSAQSLRAGPPARFGPSTPFRFTAHPRVFGRVGCLRGLSCADPHISGAPRGAAGGGSRRCSRPAPTRCRPTARSVPVGCGLGAGAGAGAAAARRSRPLFHTLRSRGGGRRPLFRVDSASIVPSRFRVDSESIPSRF